MSTWICVMCGVHFGPAATKCPQCGSANIKKGDRYYG